METLKLFKTLEKIEVGGIQNYMKFFYLALFMKIRITFYKTKCNVIN